ncbi:MAG: hypothetical protein ACNYPI_04465 [Arenicellales bacterium WSBS_2016_MAG_OTU3]
MQQSPDKPFRFFDSREKYLMFVTTCSEKWAIAAHVQKEFSKLTPTIPALRLFDAGTGDGTVLSSVLRGLHQEFPTIPIMVGGKEISVEDVRMTLEKLPDRFAEHPQLVVAITNMHYIESPSLTPTTEEKRARLNWHEIELDGNTAHGFDEQIVALKSLVEDGWQVRPSPQTGNPMYVTPSVIVLYRKDQKFRLDSVIPRKLGPPPKYDLVIAAQPYRLRQPAAKKASMVLEPLIRALAPGGRMIAIQSTGQDPGMDIVRQIWPDEEPFQTPGSALIDCLHKNLAGVRDQYQFGKRYDENGLFRYFLHVSPQGIQNDETQMSTAAVLAAWNAAVYVAQIDDARSTEAMSHANYLAVTRNVLARYGGLWFLDESFVISRNHQIVS